MRNEIFISYSHKDSKWLKKLRVMLKPTEQNSSVRIWADTEIKPGQFWKAEIESALTRAKVAILLVSPDFLDSKFITELELPKLLEAAEQDGLKVVWIPIKPCLYKHTQIERYKAAYNPEKPLAILKTAAVQDAALAEISEEIVSLYKSEPVAESYSDGLDKNSKNAKGNENAQELGSNNISDDSRPTTIHWRERDQKLLRKYFEMCAEYDDFFNDHVTLDENLVAGYLESSGLAAKSKDGHFYLTEAGVLLCCNRFALPRNRFHVDVKFQILESEGGDTNEELWGSILHLYHELIERLSPLYSRRMGLPQTRNESGTEAIIFEYPRTAIIEALANFLIHRDYSLDDIGRIKIYPDRVQFVNPGTSEFTPEFLMSINEPIEPRYLRNQRLIEAMNKARLNQREGGGILRIKYELEKNGSYRADGALGLLIENDEKRNRFSLTIYKRLTGQSLRISIARLPVTDEYLVGREMELQRLDMAWKDPKIHIISIIAWGGMGKTALVTAWLERMADDQYRGAERVFGWTFYSQGTSDERAASADAFIDVALRWFGDPDSSAGSPWDKGERLAGYVRRQRTLLILDGLESLQYPPGPTEGRLRDPALQALLRGLAAENPGLCVITSREAVTDLAARTESTAPVMRLEHLSAVAGAILLRKLGVQGTAEELQKAAQEVQGHALALTLLGKYLHRVWGGDVRRRDQVRLWEADERQGGHARRAMEAYERWFGQGPEVAILRLVGLFDRAADGAALSALRAEPVIAGLTDALHGKSEADWRYAVGSLREAGLLAAADPHAPDTLDAHPLVREHFGEQLRAQHPEAWRAGHARLYEHLKAAAPELPETLEAMLPLYAAVRHGCRAGRRQEALNEVYWRRILRGNEHFSWSKLGAFGAEMAALAGFFERPWSHLAAELSEADKGFVLNAAGFHLRALGRLAEAMQPMRAALEAAIAQEDWKNAAIYAGNLSELWLTLGDLNPAREAAAQSVALAERSGDAFERMVSRATLAEALHQAGRWAEAQATFAEAEALQKERQPQYPLLYSLQGFRYCALLLWQGEAVAAGWLAPGQLDWTAEGLEGMGPDASARDLALARFRAVQRRAAQTLEWEGGRLLDIALDHLTLGQALLLEAVVSESSDFQQAAQHLNQAVDGLRQAGQQHELPRGLLARAALHRHQDNLPAAEADLTEALDIATRGQMKLHQADAHLEYARLHLARGDREQARTCLQTAKQMIEQMGYHRQDWEIVVLERYLQQDVLNELIIT